MKTKNIFPIRYVVRQSGLTAHVIRVWERRYQAVVPRRTDTNRRLYSESDVKRLQLLKKAVDAGHSISQVANMNAEELMRLINLELPDVPEVSAGIEPRSLDTTYFYEISLSGRQVRMS